MSICFLNYVSHKESHKFTEKLPTKSFATEIARDGYIFPFKENPHHFKSGCLYKPTLA